MVARIAKPDAEPAPAWAVELLRRMDGVEQAVRTIAVPATLLTIKQAAERLGKSERAADEFTRRHFTDTRPSHDRRPGVRRLVYGDEVDAYVRGGVPGLRKFRRLNGRMR